MIEKPSPSDSSPSRSRTIMITFALVIAGLMGLALFSLSRLSTSPFTSPLKNPSIQDTLRQDLPQFEHPGLAQALNDLAAQDRWALLTFWSVTCAPCMEELPTLNALSSTWQGPGLQVVTVNLDSAGSEELDLAKRFLQEEQITLPTFFDPNGSLKEAFAINEYPQHFLIAPTKKIVWRESGAFHWDSPTARDQLLKLLEREAPESTEGSPE